MVDTCRVQQPSEDVWNPTTATFDPGPPSYSYEGPCLVKSGATQARTVDVVGQQKTIQIDEVQFPVDTSTAVDVGHVIEILESGDAALIGRTFRVEGRFGQTHAASRRFPVVEVTSRAVS
jgi:hypothetical protein